VISLPFIVQHLILLSTIKQFRFNEDFTVRHSLKTGLSFGLTSGIITTLGLMVGLHSGTHSKLAVIGGILTIAIADAFSDALGIHVSEESENKHTTREIWESTLCTFAAKFVFAMTFVVPVLVFPLATSIVISIIWGLSLLAIFSYYLAQGQEERPWKVVSEHVLIAVVVIIVTHYVGHWIGSAFS
jgi:VIT1/CCC1 family predicted Fe2+/Mn2+ transporter